MIQSPELSRWHKVLLASLVPLVPLGIWLYSFAGPADDAIRAARREQCGIAYNMLLRQLLERADQPGGQADPTLLAQLQLQEAQPCADGSFRDDLLPEGGVSRLLPLTQSPRSNQADLIAELYALMKQVGQRSVLASDPAADTRAVMNLLQPRFLEGMPLLGQIALARQAPDLGALQRHLAAVERDLVAVSRAGDENSAEVRTLTAGLARASDAYLAALRMLQRSASPAEQATAARERLFRLYDAAALWQYSSLRTRIDERATDRQLAVAAMVVMLLLVGGIGVTTATGLMRDSRRRLQDLVAASRRTARGELGLAVSVRGKDKVAELESAFNEMTAELRASYQKIIDALEAERATAEGSRRYLRKITNSVPGAVFELVHRGGRLELPFVSAGVQVLIGIDAETISRDANRLLALVLAEDRRALLHKLQSLAGDAGFQHDVRIRHKLTRELRWMHLRGSSPQPQADGSVRRFGMISDITQQKLLESSLADARDAAQRAERVKTEFLRNVSHELRTPMNGILGMSYLALQNSPDLRQRDYLNKINGAAITLIQIIDDMLDFSKMEAGQLALDRLEFDLADVLDPLLQSSSPRARAKDIEFRLLVGHGLPHGLVGDPRKVGQILTHFINNAIKFTEAGRIVLDVSQLRTSSDSVELRFSVTDTGVGLSRERLQGLFESISQPDAARPAGGAGLGLVVSKRLADLMDARLGAESTPGRGSTFWLEVRFGLARTLVPRPMAAG